MYKDKEIKKNVKNIFFINMWRESVFDIYIHWIWYCFDNYLTYFVPVFKYCYSGSFWLTLGYLQTFLSRTDKTIYIIYTITFPGRKMPISPDNLFIEVFGAGPQKRGDLSICYMYYMVNPTLFVWYTLSVTCDRLVVSSTNKTDRYELTEILLKVALNTETPNSEKKFETSYILIHFSWWPF